MRSGAEEPRHSSPFSLSSVSSVSRLTEPGAHQNALPAAEKRLERRRRRRAQERVAFPSAVKWPEAEDIGGDPTESPEARGNGKRHGGFAS